MPLGFGTLAGPGGTGNPDGPGGVAPPDPPLPVLPPVPPTTMPPTPPLPPVPTMPPVPDEPPPDEPPIEALLPPEPPWVPELPPLPPTPEVAPPVPLAASFPTRSIDDSPAQAATTKATAKATAKMKGGKHSSAKSLERNGASVRFGSGTWGTRSHPRAAAIRSRLLIPGYGPTDPPPRNCAGSAWPPDRRGRRALPHRSMIEHAVSVAQRTSAPNASRRSQNQPGSGRRSQTAGQARLTNRNMTAEGS